MFALGVGRMSVDRDKFLPSSPPPALGIPPSVRALLRALALDLARLAALLARYAREEEARRAARMRPGPGVRRKS